MSRPLTELQVLALDCQATGARPAKSHLLETGWVKTCAAASAPLEPLPVQSYLVRLPQDAEIPAAVQRVTGISKETLQRSHPSADVWKKLDNAAQEIALSNQMAVCPTIIHYARYEAPFLKTLHARSAHKEGFPLKMICTHEIARRLLPGLPRKGLRAVAGYFGHAVPQQRRSAAHAIATAVIWQRLVHVLSTQYGIEDLIQLLDWLNHTTPQTRPARVYPMKPELRLNLPKTPGIYRMRRANGDLLYIGKAKSLQTRVNSYFRPNAAQAEHILEMLSQAADLDVTPTGSALEAAVLESDEIKGHAPPYNIALQKGQRRLGFCSRDLLAHADGADSIHCIGPLPEGNAVALTAFGAWVADIHGWDGSTQTLLGLPEAYAPPADCMAGGLALFRHRHLHRLKHAAPLRILTGLGHTLWRERLASLKMKASEARPEAAEDECVAEAHTAQNEPSWTPETVADAVEKLTMHSTVLIRRARWLCALSESTLAWETREAKRPAKIVLVFENGAVCRRAQLPVAKRIPVPPGYKKTGSQRQKSFDLATYERLRVVTSELRRLVGEARRIEIRLSSGAVLKRRHLVKILPWV
jgi:DNA polymerase-3 subunit epsilon